MLNSGAEVEVGGWLAMRVYGKLPGTGLMLWALAGGHVTPRRRAASTNLRDFPRAVD